MLQLLLAAVAFSELVPRPPGPADAFDLFREGDLGYSHFRIPILATVDGPVPALLLFVEARKFSFMDWGTHGLLMRASYDGGAGWTPATQVVTDPESSNKTMEIAGHGLDGIGQPSSVIVDRVRHKVILMFSPCEENCSTAGGNVGAVGGGGTWDAYKSSCLRQVGRGPYSCGKTVESRAFTVTADTSSFPLRWGGPVEFTRQLSPNWRVFTGGPSAGIQTPSGRLLVCGWIIEEGLRRPAGYDPLGYTAGSAMIYSDNGGVHWHSGGRIDVCSMLSLTNCTFGRKATDECQPVLLNNGSILVTLRSEWQGGERLHFLLLTVVLALPFLFVTDCLAALQTGTNGARLALMMTACRLSTGGSPTSLTMATLAQLCGMVPRYSCPMPTTQQTVPISQSLAVETKG